MSTNGDHENTNTNDGNNGPGLRRREDDGDIATVAVAVAPGVAPGVPAAVTPNNNNNHVRIINNNHNDNDILNLDNIVARFFNEIEERQRFRPARLIRGVVDNEPTLPRFNPMTNHNHHNHRRRRLLFDESSSSSSDDDDDDDDGNDNDNDQDQYTSEEEEEDLDVYDEDSDDSSSMDKQIRLMGRNDRYNGRACWVEKEMQRQRKRYNNMMCVLNQDDGGIFFDLVGRGISDEDDYLRSNIIATTVGVNNNSDEIDNKICQRLTKLIQETTTTSGNNNKTDSNKMNKKKNKSKVYKEEDDDDEGTTTTTTTAEVINVKRFVVRDIIFTTRTADAMIDTLQYYANLNYYYLNDNNIKNNDDGKNNNGNDDDEEKEKEEEEKPSDHHKDEEEEEVVVDKKLPTIPLLPSSSDDSTTTAQLALRHLDINNNRGRMKKNKRKNKNVVVVQFDELCLDNVRQNVEFQRVFKSALELHLFTTIRIDQPHFAWTTDDDDESSSSSSSPNDDDDDGSVVQDLVEEHAQQQQQQGNGGAANGEEEEQAVEEERAEEAVEEVDGDDNHQNAHEEEEQEQGGEEGRNNNTNNENNAIDVYSSSDDDDSSMPSDGLPLLDDSDDDDSIPELIRPRHLRDETAFAIRDAMLSSNKNKGEGSDTITTTTTLSEEAAAATTSIKNVESGLLSNNAVLRTTPRGLQTLIVSRVQLDEDSWDALGQGLAYCTSLKELVFKNVRFGGRSEEDIDRELGKFIRGIGQNESLEKFTFQNTRELNDAQLAQLVMSLPLHNIQYLNINETPWNEQTIRVITNQLLKLPNCKLNSLSLESPTLLRTGMNLFGMLLFPSTSSAQSTSLAKPLLENLLDGISNNHSLHTLSLKNCGLDDEGYQMVMKSLSSNPNSSLEKLDLSSNWISDLDTTPPTSSSSSDGHDDETEQEQQEQDQKATGGSSTIDDDDSNSIKIDSSKCRRLRKLNLSDNPVFGLSPFSLRFLKDKNKNFNRKEWLKKQQSHIIHLLEEFPGLGQLCGMQDINNKELYTPYIQHLLDVNKSGLHLMLRSSRDVPPLPLWTLVLARTTYQHNTAERRNRSKKRHSDTIYNLLQGPVLAGRESYY